MATGQDTEDMPSTTWKRLTVCSVALRLIALIFLLLSFLQLESCEDCEIGVVMRHEYGDMSQRCVFVYKVDAPFRVADGGRAELSAGVSQEVLQFSATLKSDHAGDELCGAAAEDYFTFISIADEYHAHLDSRPWTWNSSEEVAAAYTCSPGPRCTWESGEQRCSVTHGPVARRWAPGTPQRRFIDQYEQYTLPDMQDSLEKIREPPEGTVYSVQPTKDWKDRGWVIGASCSTPSEIGWVKTPIVLGGVVYTTIFVIHVCSLASTWRGSSWTAAESKPAKVLSEAAAFLVFSIIPSVMTRPLLSVQTLNGSDTFGSITVMPVPSLMLWVVLVPLVLGAIGTGVFCVLRFCTCCQWCNNLRWAVMCLFAVAMGFSCLALSFADGFHLVFNWRLVFSLHFGFSFAAYADLYQLFIAVTFLVDLVGKLSLLHTLLTKAQSQVNTGRK